MAKKTSKMSPVLPDTTWVRGGSKRRIVSVSPIEVTYEQLTATKGPGSEGEVRTVGRATFYNWVRLASQVAQ